VVFDFYVWGSLKLLRLRASPRALQHSEALP
jgi:hypothetical protein